jgi:type IV pilus assembly protein PilW
MRTSIARGFTLVELLAALALALIVVTAATAFAMSHLRDDRAAWARSRLQRELRMAMDVIAHDLRRAGHWPGATAAAWGEPDSGAASLNPYAALAPRAGASDAMQFAYAPSSDAHAVLDEERLGFRLRRGVVEMMLGQGNWQALTDAGSVVVTELGLTPSDGDIALESLCPLACPGCGPTQSVRSVAIAIAGRSLADARVEHAMRSVVRLRNDVVTGDCPDVP